MPATQLVRMARTSVRTAVGARAAAVRAASGFGGPRHHRTHKPLAHGAPVTAPAAACVPLGEADVATPGTDSDGEEGPAPGVAGGGTTGRAGTQGSRGKPTRVASATTDGVRWYNGKHRVNAFDGMELMLLGTAAAGPSPYRNVTSAVLRLPATNWMFDCGEGTQHQVQRSALRTGGINKIFVTHLHGDHVFGLPGMVSTLLVSSPPDITLDVYGPRGVADFLYMSLSYLQLESRQKLNLRVHELVFKRDPTRVASFQRSGHDFEEIVPTGRNEWMVCQDGPFTVRAGPLQHRIQCFGYVVTEDDVAGAIDADKVTAMGLKPGPLYRDLKNGIAVTTPEGRVIHPSEVVSPPRPGRRVVVLGDTCNSDAIAFLCENADFMLHECTHEDGNDAKAKITGHSTHIMAAKFAQLIKVRALGLTHFSNRIASRRADSDLQTWLPDAAEQQAAIKNGTAGAEMFGLLHGDFTYPTMEDKSNLVPVIAEVRQHFQGRIVACRDFMTFPIPRRDEPN